MVASNTFDIPASAAGKKCEFVFELDSTATLSGSTLFDVFVSQAPPTESTTGWPQGNLRGGHLGRMKAAQPGQATVDSEISSQLTAADCQPGQIHRELVGVYDADHIEWNEGLTGPRIRVVTP